MTLLFSLLITFQVIASTPEVTTSSEALTEESIPSLWGGIQNDLVTYEELMSYDSFARNRYSKYKLTSPPKAQLLAVFKRFRTRIIEIAKEFQVDPRLLIAMISTEHTLNVQIDDVITGAAARTRAEKGQAGTYMFRQVSYGFGQIYEYAALAAEPFVAQVRGRDELPIEEVRKNLLSMDGALSYAAGIVLATVDAYSRVGIDISHRPGIISTLYNLGDYDKYAEKSAQQGRDPRINYFGFYTLTHWQAFHDTIYAPVNNYFNYQFNSNDLISADECDSFLKCQVAKGADASFYKGTLKIPEDQNLTLSYAPNHCDSQERVKGSGGAIQDFYLNHTTKVKTEVGGGEFEILQTSLGCDVSDWSLVKFHQNKAMGWVRHDELFKELDFLYQPVLCHKDYSTCSEKLEATVAKVIEEKNPELISKVKVYKDSNADTVQLVSFPGYVFHPDYYYVNTAEEQNSNCSKETGDYSKIQQKVNEFSQANGFKLNKYKMPIEEILASESFLISMQKEYDYRDKNQLVSSWDLLNNSIEARSYFSEKEFLILIQEASEKIVNHPYFFHLSLGVNSHWGLVMQIMSLKRSGIATFPDCHSGCYINFSKQQLLEQVDLRLQYMMSHPSSGFSAFHDHRVIYSDWENKIRNGKIVDYPQVLLPYSIRDSLGRMNYHMEIVPGPRRTWDYIYDFYLKNYSSFEALIKSLERRVQDKSLKKSLQNLQDKVASLSQESRLLFKMEGESMLVNHLIGEIGIYLWINGHDLEPEIKDHVRYWILTYYSKPIKKEDLEQAVIKSAINFIQNNTKNVRLQKVTERYEEEYHQVVGKNADVLERHKKRLEKGVMGWLSRCPYDPLLTVEMVKEISKLQCFEAILMPKLNIDEREPNFILDSLNSLGIRWRFYNTGDDESFGVLMKEQCQ